MRCNALASYDDAVRCYGIQICQSVVVLDANDPRDNVQTMKATVGKTCVQKVPRRIDYQKNSKTPNCTKKPDS